MLECMKSEWTMPYSNDELLFSLSDTLSDDVQLLSQEFVFR